MAEPHAATAAHGHAETHGPNLGAYLAVFGALCVCTLISFIVNGIFGPGNLTGAGIIMFVAIIKATLVCMIFMHLKWDWKDIYFLMIPVLILTVMTIVVLLPDTVLMWPADPATPPLPPTE